MRFSVIVAALLIAATAQGQTPLSKPWTDLQAKRETLPGLHQEFEVAESYIFGRNSQESRRKIVLDMSHNKWREQSVSGSGNRTRMFDGKDLFVMEAEGDEYVRTKRKEKENDPEPVPYSFLDLDWAKAAELERVPCGFKMDDHTCIVIDAPLKGWSRVGVAGRITRLANGTARVAIDTETGLLVQSITQEAIESNAQGYTLTMKVSVTGMSYGTAPDASLFKLPESGVHEVKEFTRWNAARIKKVLIGKPAPELEVTDIRGNRISLGELKGKTVLLDFWTTWCPPCLADAPALDKLFLKYGGKDLAIVGISVEEGREIVEKFLKKHSHSFPVVLTSENELPRPYQIGVFPTYMVIGPDGTLTTAVEGDQGFGELRKFLEKAGMETK